ncbi:hypothetical protein P154DRAFT_526066 [Amniculicola lignicola CBS 123094]|uniref:2-dehydropantoate 2-reductase n=1 Tax=Amniculicola lignicola CBS 123094 TaxID=1392246 RepID=A0A6A5W246_9PLEO|nr:hypothetical protein P154DRAFT_526066 [Amniculicola lignicola CBS 123094]
MEPRAKQGSSAAEEDRPTRVTSNEINRNYENITDFYRTKPVLDRRIHILGLGSVGIFIAHSLRGIPNPPPTTLLFHRRKYIEHWNSGKNQKLSLVTDYGTEKREGYDVEYVVPRYRRHGKETGMKADGSQLEASTEHLQEGESNEPISSLIVCTKTPLVLQALSAVKHRLHKKSVILFMQNGMGTVDEVNREIFPDPETRPYYMLGINSHGMHGVPDDPFTIVHAGFGTICLGALPPERLGGNAPYSPPRKDFRPFGHSEPVTPKHPANPDSDAPAAQASTFKWGPNHRYLLRTLLRTPALCATGFSPPDLLQMQLEKLAVNCVINPLTVMLDARNGSVLYNYHLTRVMRLLLSEISLVIRNLPELQYIPNVSQRFDPGRLESMVVGVANRTKDNISSMLADVRAGRRTEIDYINGWIVKRGEEQGVSCLVNYMLLRMVKGKAGMVQLEMGEDVPFVGDKPGEGPVAVKTSITAEPEAKAEGQESGPVHR